MNNIFRKLTAQDVEARVQSVDENGFILLIYKNARVDQNILDETVGAMNWQNKFYECKGNLYCSLGININYNTDKEPYWVWKDDCGTESKTEAEKGEASDARKRAGFAWGIGRELYTSPKIKIKGHIIEKGSKYYTEYYEFIITELEVSDARKITALTIIGKSIQGGYHEDVVFEWKETSKTHQNQTKTATSISKSSTTKTSENTPNNALKQVCANCGEEVSSIKVAEYSKANFGKVLCFDCQKQSIKINNTSFGGGNE